MNFVFNDLDWQLVLDSYKKNQSLLSPIMRGNISNLISNISSTKTITNMQQANLIIALLQCKKDYCDFEECNKVLIPTEEETESNDLIIEDKNKKLMILLEQLQMFVLQFSPKSLINQKDLESLIERK